MTTRKAITVGACVGGLLLVGGILSIAKMRQAKTESSCCAHSSSTESTEKTNPSLSSSKDCPYLNSSSGADASADPARPSKGGI